MRRSLADVVAMFPPAVDVVATDGAQLGVIVKYPRYHLKIYDGKDGGYKVLGYWYGRITPLFVHEVPAIRIKEYAAVFRPNCIPVEFPYATVGVL